MAIESAEAFYASLLDSFLPSGSREKLAAEARRFARKIEGTGQNSYDLGVVERIAAGGRVNHLFLRPEKAESPIIIGSITYSRRGNGLHPLRNSLDGSICDEADVRASLVNLRRTIREQERRGAPDGFWPQVAVRNVGYFARLSRDGLQIVPELDVYVTPRGDSPEAKYIRHFLDCVDKFIA